MKLNPLPLHIVMALALAAAGTVSSAARAQLPGTLDRVAAEALFDESLRLMESERYEQACPKLEQSYRLDPGIGTLLYLADCYQSLGKTASAWMTFREAAFAAAEVGQDEREQTALAHAQQIRPELTLLRLELERIPPGVRIEYDGHRVTSELIGVPFAVDPGRHTLDVTAPGLQPWRQVVELENKPGVEAVRIPVLQPPAKPAKRTETMPQARSPKPPPEHGLRPLGWILLGAGVSAIGAGGGLALVNRDPWPGPILLGGSGVLSAAAGTFMLLNPTLGRVQIALATGPTGAGLIARRSF